MTTILIIIFFVIGTWFGWKYENLINDLIEHFKSK